MKLARIGLFIFFLFYFGQTQAQGTWTPVANPLPATTYIGGVMLLLTDGTVMCKTGGSVYYDTNWALLTPDIHGSYVNGTWSAMNPMHDTRYLFSSQVLPNGNVYVAGGELGDVYNDSSGEVYNTVTKTWSRIPGNPGYFIFDAESELLCDGTVLQCTVNPWNYYTDTDNLIYSPVTGSYHSGPFSRGAHTETTWVKLPDSSVLVVDVESRNAERYIPKLHKWIKDDTVPVNLYNGDEIGAAFLLPNGKAFFIGAVTNTAIYTPSGDTSHGTWTVGPVMPSVPGYGQLGSFDGPAAMMVNGKILCTLTPGDNTPPTFFYEFDYLTNTFTRIKASCGGDSLSYSAYTNMLVLPDGNILFGATDSTRYYIYTPAGSPIPQGKPVINSVFPDSCNRYMITGKVFNGISEGAAYGDDWQMATNYPLVRLSSGTNVYYCRTTNWNRPGAVMTDSAEDTVYFTLPSLPGGTYSLVVVANGFASSPVPFTTFGVGITANNINFCHGTGSATAVASHGSKPYTYLWSPGGSTDSIESGLTAGTYTVTVTEVGGCSASASVTITQPGNLTISTSVTPISCTGYSNGSATVNASGGSAPYTYNWSNGGTGATINGLTAGIYSITVSDTCGYTAAASVTISTPPALTAFAVLYSDELCTGDSTGQAVAYIDGGSAPFTYNWSGGAGTGDTASGLKGGTYTLTVTDACGNTSTSSVTVTTPPAVAVDISSAFNEPCYGDSTDGTIIADAYLGRFPYTYSWSPRGGTAAYATGLSAGTYTVTVTDFCGDTASISVTLTQPPRISATHDSTADNGSHNGTAGVNVSGGTSPYSYLWAPGGKTSASITGLSGGTYTCTITDSNGCSYTTSVTVNIIAGIKQVNNSSAGIVLYPNPNNGQFTIEEQGVSPPGPEAVRTGDKEQVEIYNMLGEKIYTAALSIQYSAFNIDLGSQPNGIYLYRLINEKGSLVSDGKFIIQK